MVEIVGDVCTLLFYVQGLSLFLLRFCGLNLLVREFISVLLLEFRVSAISLLLSLACSLSLGVKLEDAVCC